MKIIFIWLLSLLVFTSFGYGEIRNWTSSEGQKITAELVNYSKENNEVILRKNGNKTYTLSLDKLSELDREWLNQRHAEEKRKKAEMAKNAGKTIPMKSDGEFPTDYYVYLPKNFDASKKHPILILFSPSGVGKKMLNNARQGCDALGWIAVGCDTFKNSGDEKEFTQRFTDLLPHIETNIPHDPEKLYMGGFSGGALRAYRYSAEFERPWKGILAYGGWLGKPAFKTGKKMRVAIVNGDTDKGANNFVDRDTKLLTGKRCKVEYITFPGGHTIAPSDVTEKAMRWLASED